PGRAAACIDIPRMRAVPGGSIAISAPSRRIAPIVEATSRPDGSPSMRAWPAPAALNITARCAIDLSPGTAIVPRRGPRARATSRDPLTCALRRRVPTRTSRRDDLLSQFPRRLDDRADRALVAVGDGIAQIVPDQAEFVHRIDDRFAIEARDVDPH